MKTLKCIGSGSSGNSWLLDIDGEQLLLDAGMRIGQIKQALDWKIGGLQGVVISHAHRL